MVHSLTQPHTLQLANTPLCIKTCSLTPFSAPALRLQLEGGCFQGQDVMLQLDRCLGSSSAPPY